MGVSRAEGEDSLDSKKNKFSIKKPSSALGLTKHTVSTEVDTPAPGTPAVLSIKQKGCGMERSKLA